MSSDKRHQPPKRGFWSERPASIWQEGLVTGNGTLGMIVCGDPRNESVIFNHERLYEPLRDEPLQPPDIAKYMPRVRELMLEGHYAEAHAYSIEMARREGMPSIEWTDPYHPAFRLTIESEGSGDVTDYARSLDFATGEIAVGWKDDEGTHLRTAFVSRSNNFGFIRILPPRGSKLSYRIALVPNNFSSDFASQVTPGNLEYPVPEITVTEEGISYFCKYPRSTRGYSGGVRVIASGGDSDHRTGALRVVGANSIVLITRVESLEDVVVQYDQSPNFPDMGVDYDESMERHTEIHGRIFDRVSIDIDGGNDRAASTEELIRRQKDSEEVIPALIEKLFDMGRFAFICASGEWPTNLSGIWNGEWRPAWCGDFTCDANLNLQMAAANIGAMAEGMMSYTRLISGLLADWRTSAKRLHGCRGVFASTRTAGRNGLSTHFSDDFPGHFWMSGAAWLTEPMYEYYLVTGDRKYLEHHLLPLLEEVAQFFEDFLSITDGEGKFVFVPSYSPENRAENHTSLASVNATIDIASTKGVISKLIAIYEEIGSDPDVVGKWRSFLLSLPPYLVNTDGALKEWSHPDFKDHYDHRHASHLYPVWPGMEINPEDTPELFAAAKVAAHKRGRGNESAHGLAHMALIYARLKEASWAYENVYYMLTEEYLLPSLFTYHNPGRIYNSDMLASFPAIIIEMLVFSRPGFLELLPALPHQWKKGSLSGIESRSQLTISSLTWDLVCKSINITLISRIDQKITLMTRRGIQNIVAISHARIEESPLGGMARHLTMAADQKGEFTIELGE